tara:strand:- start:3648 stop:3899 length:252 start_codon:yes stop_codon:yes gene_type:complete
MKLQVLFFSILRDVVGREQFQLELPAKKSWTVGGLLERLYADYPKLRDWDTNLLVAADMDYVDRETELRDGQEIAIMPPVQGG